MRICVNLYTMSNYICVENPSVLPHNLGKSACMKQEIGTGREDFAEQLGSKKEFLPA